MRPKQANSGKDDELLKEILLSALMNLNGATRQQINTAINDHLDPELSTQQKAMKVSNLMTRMKKQGLIQNAGTRTKPKWQAIKPPE